VALRSCQDSCRILSFPVTISERKPEMITVARFTILCLLSLFFPAAYAGQDLPYALGGPFPSPVVFAPGQISTGDYESHAAFTPDGNEVYFLKNAPDFSFWTIVVSRFENGQWTEPEIATFSGQYSDADPFITSDGRRLFFISNRPTKAGEAKQDMDIWMVERKGAGWGEPMNPGEPLNSIGNEWYPTVSSNGTLYFGSDRAGGFGNTDLYRSKPSGGNFGSPENLGAPVNSTADEFEPWIAPDQSFLVFMAGRPDSLGAYDLYVSCAQKEKWGAVRNLGKPFNSSGKEFSPKITPDGKYFYFTSTRGFGNQPLSKRLSSEELIQKLHSSGNGLGDIYIVDIQSLNLCR